MPVIITNAPLWLVPLILSFVMLIAAAVWRTGETGYLGRFIVVGVRIGAAAFCSVLLWLFYCIYLLQRNGA